MHELIIDKEYINNILYSNTSNILVDTKEPRITKYHTYSKGYTNGTFYIEWQGANTRDIIFQLENTNISITSCLINISPEKQSCTFNVDLSGYSSINYVIYIKDIADNVDSIKDKIIVDTTPPQIDKFAYSISRTFVTFNISITELNFDEVNFINATNTKTDVRLCSVLKNNYCTVKRSFQKGYYNLSITITDKAGNKATRYADFTIN
jgi:hypothetical protein